MAHRRLTFQESRNNVVDVQFVTVCHCFGVRGVCVVIIVVPESVVVVMVVAAAARCLMDRV